VLGPLDAGPLAEVLAIAATRGAPVVATSQDTELAAFVASHPPALGGAHQVDNAKIAVAMARRAELSDSAIAEGLRLVRWPGRLETVHTPLGEVLLDAAHNPDGALALAAALRARGRDPQGVALVFGALGDKDYAGMLGLLAPHAAHRVYVAPEGRRPAELAALMALAEGGAASSVPEALGRGRKAVGARGLVVVTGSIFLVGAARAHLLGLPRDPAIAL
jgi:dihydrofolate synthase/folylpolyglutamate synthase